MLVDITLYCKVVRVNARCLSERVDADGKVESDSTSAATIARFKHSG